MNKNLKLNSPVEWQGDTELLAYTFKILKGKPVEESYNYIIRALEKNGVILHNIFERDGKNRLHIHGVFKPFKNNFTYPIYKCVHSKFKPIYQMSGWVKYINKNQPIKAENLDLSDKTIDNKIYMF